MPKDVIIVTGSCGRIGSAVIKKLGDNYSIVGFELLHALYASANEELIPVDISSDESVAQAFKHIRHFYGNKITAVIHLAAYYSFKDAESPLYDKITVQGTERLLKELQDFEVGQFMFTSTMLVHEPTKPGEPITEESPVVPRWAYPISKVKTEKMMREKRGKIPIVMLRVAGVYDDQCHSIPISHQIQRIYEKQINSRFFPGDLTHGASFVHMDDLVDAILLCIEKRKALPPETVLLIGEPKTLSTDDLQKKISKILFDKEIHTYRIPQWVAVIGAWVQCQIPSKSPPFIRPWMVHLADDHYELNVDLAKKLLGWEPKKNLEECLPIMIHDLNMDPVAWYKKNGLQMPYHLKKKYNAQEK